MDSHTKSYKSPFQGVPIKKSLYMYISRCATVNTNHKIGLPVSKVGDTNSQAYYMFGDANMQLGYLKWAILTLRPSIYLAISTCS